MVLVHTKKGFTSIELLIVVALIAIMVSISFAAYTSFLKKAKTIEALVAIDHVAGLENLYYIENGRYTDNTDAIGLSLVGPLKYYAITINVPAGPNPQSFEAIASGNVDSDPDIDVWTINQEKKLNHVTID
ncbi:MAG: type IV pilin protein [Thermodesulfobacteriota bacterium]